MLVLGLGLGLLVGCCLDSGFWCCILGVAAVMTGLLCLLKR